MVERTPGQPDPSIPLEVNEQAQETINVQRPEIIILPRAGSQEEIATALEYFVSDQDPTVQNVGQAIVDHTSSLLQMPNLQGILVAEGHRTVLSYVTREEVGEGFHTIARSHANLNGKLEESGGLGFHARYATCGEDFDGFVQQVTNVCDADPEGRYKVVAALKFV